MVTYTTRLRKPPGYRFELLWVFVFRFRPKLLGDGSVWSNKGKKTLVSIKLEVGVQIVGGIRIRRFKWTGSGEDNTIFTSCENCTIRKLPFGDISNIIGERPTCEIGIRETRIVEFNPVRFPSIPIK